LPRYTANQSPSAPDCCPAAAYRYPEP
jgi:hypothetical protein